MTMMDAGAGNIRIHRIDVAGRFIVVMPISNEATPETVIACLEGRTHALNRWWESDDKFLVLGEKEGVEPVRFERVD